MGGMGSGGWMRVGSKATVDSQYAVDIRYLKKQKSLWAGNNGSLTWSSHGEKVAGIDYQVKENGIKLIYNSRVGDSGAWESIEQFVAFDYTPCNYGGKRTWLLCTGCNQRVTSIYASRTYFLCRHCCGINYQSQHEDYNDRQLSKAHNIKTKLGGQAGIATPFPPKPKGMHWKTYYRFQMRTMKGEASYMQKMDRFFTAFSARYP